MKLDEIASYLTLMVIILYLVMSFVIVKDYGITIDEPENFATGHKYLHYYITGELNLTNDIPKIEGHPNFYIEAFKDFPYRYGAVANTLSALTCYIFYQRFHLLDPISAHHIAIPILTAIFLYILFYFVRKYWGNIAGFMSVAALISYPQFFGHTFNNIKDVPQTIFSSLTIMLFAEWWFTKKTRYIYFTFILFGIALATKLDSIFVAVILTLWLAPPFIQKLFRNESVKTRVIAHMAGGTVIAALLFITFYPPLLQTGYKNKTDFLCNMLAYYLHVGVARNISWNLYAPLQISYVTPDVMLFLFIVGLTWIFYNNMIKNRINFLLLVWTVFPVLRQCLPAVNHYDGIRQFLIFLVPFTIISSVGAKKIIDVFIRLTKIKRSILTGFVCALFLVPNIYAIVSTHPYQTTYFNCITGGLKGAQERGIPFSCDYWLNSYRRSGEWLQKNAKNNAKYCTFPPSGILSYYIDRKNLEAIPQEAIFQNNISNLYFVFVPRTWWPGMIYVDISNLLSKLKEYEVVYQIKRQGGEVVTIYHKP